MINDDLEKDTDARIIFGNENADRYVPPIAKYDEDLIVTDEMISTFPDLQNNGNVNGSLAKIQHVGIHNFRLPLKYVVKNGEPITLETSVTGTVSIEACTRGVNMSRIIRTFYEHKDNPFIISNIEKVLHDYKKKIQTFEAKLFLKFSYPMIQKSLRSGLEGYQYYDVVFEVDIDKDDKVTKIMHVDYCYSSTCPCSYELSEHARKYRNRAVAPHNQRSTARLSIKFDDFIWVEDIKDICDRALHTEVQVMVKRQDEMAYSEMNGAYPKFVEDAVRLLYNELEKDSRITDFKVIVEHFESLHPFDATAVIIKGVEGGFNADVSRETFNSMYHISR